MTQPQAVWGSNRWFWGLLAAGLLFRIIVFTQTGDLGTKIVDEQHYSQLAKMVVQHGVYGMDPGTPTSMRPPLFPGMVAAVWSVTGVGNFQIIRAVNIVLAGLTVWVIFLLGRDLYGPSVGRGAAVLFWLYLSLVFFDFTILTETLFTLLFATCTLLLARLVREPRVWTALAAGAAMGAAALTRSVLWPFPLVLCPVLVVILPGRFTTRVAFAALFLVGHVVVLTPWSVRNTRLQGTTTIVDTMGGLNLRMGNYEHTPDDRMWDVVHLRGEKNWATPSPRTSRAARTSPRVTRTSGPRSGPFST